MQNLKEQFHEALTRAGLLAGPVLATEKQRYAFLAGQSLRSFLEKPSIALLDGELEAIRPQLRAVSSRLDANREQLAEIQSRIDHGNILVDEMRKMLTTRMALEALIAADEREAAPLRAQQSSVLNDRASRNRDRDLVLRERCELATRIANDLTPPVETARTEVEMVAGWVVSQEAQVRSVNDQLAELQTEIAPVEQQLRELDAQLAEIDSVLEPLGRELSQIRPFTEPSTKLLESRIESAKRKRSPIQQEWTEVLNTLRALQRTEYNVRQSSQAIAINLNSTICRLESARAELKKVEAVKLAAEKELRGFDEVLSWIEGNPAEAPSIAKVLDAHTHA